MAKHSFNPNSRIFFGIMLALALVSGVPQASHAESSTSSAEPKHFLFHIKTSLDEDDAQICVAPNLAWAALAAGHQVTLLFDASAVTSVVIRNRFLKSPSTDMDRADLPDREKQALSEQFNVPLKEIPNNYGEYLEFLKAKGARLFINKTMTILYKIDASKIDPVLEPASLARIIELMENADVYVVY